VCSSHRYHMPEAAVKRRKLISTVAIFASLDGLQSEAAREPTPLGRVHESPVDRSGTDDPDAGRGICICNPLGAADLPRSASEPCLSLVLQVRY